MPSSPDLDRLCVVLVHTRNPLNIGAAARAMANFGCTSLRLVEPYMPAWREARSAVGAGPVLKKAKEFSSLAHAIADCTLVVGTTTGARRDPKQLLKLLPDAASVIRQHFTGGRVALLFGSEKRGLSNDDLSHCHWLLRIPTSDAQPSMNLAQAVVVCLYELSRQTSSAPTQHGKAQLSPGRDRRKARERGDATAADMQRVADLLFSVLSTSGYLKPLSASVKQEKIRRLLLAMDLQKHDAELLLGMLRQIDWKLRS